MTNYFARQWPITEFLILTSKQTLFRFNCENVINPPHFALNVILEQGLVDSTMR